MAHQNNSDFWQDRPVFLTGATGLVGGWLLKRLINLKADVICLVRDSVPQSEFVRSRLYEQVKIVQGNLSSQTNLERILGEYEIDTVIHLAAQTIVSIANRNPISTFETNIAGTWRLLEACRRSPTVKQVVFASSDKAYGESKKLPYREEMPLHGIHPYDVSKSCSDLIAQAYAKTYDLPVAIARCGNFYGGGDLNWNRIIPGTIRSVERGQEPLIRSDGNYIRDYFYVKDGALAYTLLVEKLAENSNIKGEAFNFSSGDKIKVSELVYKILNLMNSSLKPKVLFQSSCEIREQYLDSGKAQELLGWQPNFSLDQGLIETISWYRNFFKL